MRLRVQLTRWIPELLSAVAILGTASPAILKSRSAVPPPAADQITVSAGASADAAVPPLVLPLAGRTRARITPAAGS